MNTHSPKVQTSVYKAPQAINLDNPFGGDLFLRKLLAEQLTGMIYRFPDGGVIAINAAWGEGKTWFGQNWHAQLKAEHYRSAYINAFEMDFVSDPFDMLISEVLAEIKGESTATHELKARAGEVVKAVMPKVAKVVTNALGKLVGTTDIVGEFSDLLEPAVEEGSEALELFLEKRIQRYEQEKKSIAKFRESLQKVVAESPDASSPKPLVIFIDELDRCRPDFAVKTVERIKHFFEVPGVIFVLLINKDQLEKAIKGCYGSEVDAHRYLSKFIHLTISLPKVIRYRNEDDNYIYCQAVAKRYGFAQDQDAQGLSRQIANFSNALKLSLRDIERCVGLLAISNVSPKHQLFMVWIIVLKITKPILLEGLKYGDQDSHRLAAQILSAAIANHDAGFSGAYSILLELHNAGMDRSELTADSNAAKFATMLDWDFSMNIHNFIPYLCKRIDLDLN